MLISCPECKREISDQAQSCPHCGRPLKTLTGQNTRQPKPQNAPIFLVLGVIALFLTFNTPRLLLFFPLMGTVGFAAISLFRSEKGRPGAVVVLLCGIALWVISEMPSTSVNPESPQAALSPGRAVNSSALDAAEIADWNWTKDPSFGTRGTIKWNVQVRNKSSNNVRSVKVDFATYDSAGKLVSTTSTYVGAIPPGETRAESSYADLYGTETRATIQIADVRFAR